MIATVHLPSRTPSEARIPGPPHELPPPAPPEIWPRVMPPEITPPSVPGIMPLPPDSPRPLSPPEIPGPPRDRAPLALLTATTEARHGVREAPVPGARVTRVRVAAWPTPVGGTRRDLGALSGAWKGVFSSQDLHQRGRIRFRLMTGAESALGEIQVPRSQPGESVRESQVTDDSAPRTFRIAFVGVHGHWVTGVLEPCEDDPGSCRVLARFHGRIRGNRVLGRYSVIETETGRVTRGGWRVRREKDVERHSVP